MSQKVLIIDDDRTERRMVAGILRGRLELEALEAENGMEGLKVIAGDEDNEIKLVILDLAMPVMDGFAALARLSRDHPRLPVIVLTGSRDTEDAVKAMKTGAVDFLSKPVIAERLAVSVRNALKMALMSREISRLRRGAEGATGFSDLTGHDGGLMPVIVTGRKAATCALPVLITGETGTGKEVFARAIHGESSRCGRAFIAVNCGAIPEKLVESTLFGHEKGAFTGAIAKAPGKFQEAHGGTIFLDEIGELPLEAQVKLLRVLQQKEVEPVGAGRPVNVDVRVISATNRDLQKEVQEGRFREDLYFRLNVIHIDMPPLRDRAGDIPALARYFIEMFCAGHNASPKEIGKEALEKLRRYDWPGNVRELENVISRTMALCDHERLEPGDFSFMPVNAVSDQPQRKDVIVLTDEGGFKSFRDLEQEIIALAIRYHGGNVSQTARVLGIAKSTLYARMEHAAERKAG